MCGKFIEKLVCSRCSKEYNPESNPFMCENKDFGRLDIIYDYSKNYSKTSSSLTKDRLKRREIRGVWRYWELSPVDRSYAVDLYEGNTPLLKAKWLGELLGLRELYLKDETRNPTSSFKDSSMAIGVAKALEIGAKVAVTASGGNAAAPLAAYVIRTGLRTITFVPRMLVWVRLHSSFFTVRLF